MACCNHEEKPKPIVGKDEIKIAMLGMVDGNGHPYSWSAMFNNYNREEMAKCPFPAIPAYLHKEPPESFGIPGAKVTHVWTDDPADAVKVSRASLVPNVVEKAEDVIGQVDAVIVATDKGNEHVERCRPFIEAGLPVFVDKPLADNIHDLKIFNKWVEEGAHIMSSSSMRYCKEFMPYRASIHNLGKLRFASISTPKSWERYGMHALEAIYPIIGPGFVSVQNSGGTKEKNIVRLTHKSGAEVVVAAIYDMYGSFGVLELLGTEGFVQAKDSDSYFSFKAQLVDYVRYLQTGVRPYPFSQTIELSKIIIAGIMSREQGGRVVNLEEIEI